MPTPRRPRRRRPNRDPAPVHQASASPTITMALGLQVRKLRSSERDQVLDLIGRAADPAGRWPSQERLADRAALDRYCFAEPGARHLVAERGGRIVGYLRIGDGSELAPAMAAGRGSADWWRGVLALRSDETFPEDLALLARLCVDPVEQRRGVGTALLAHALTTLRARGRRGLFVAPDGLPGLDPLLERAGAQRVHRFTLAGGAGRSTWLLAQGGVPPHHESADTPLQRSAPPPKVAPDLSGSNGVERAASRPNSQQEVPCPTCP